MAANQGNDLTLEQLDHAAYILRVLAHPQRLMICQILLKRRASVGDLAEAIGLRHNVVSQHLSNMRAHGLVEPERDGRAVYYRVVHPAPGWLLDCIRRNRTHDASAALRLAADRGHTTD